MAKNDPAIGGAKSREECPNRSVPFIPDPTHRVAVKTAILKVSLLPITHVEFLRSIQEFGMLEFHPVVSNKAN